MLGSKSALLRPSTRADFIALLTGFILKLPPTKNLRVILAGMGGIDQGSGSDVVGLQYSVLSCCR